MYYDNLFNKDFLYVLFIVKTEQESNRTADKLITLGYTLSRTTIYMVNKTVKEKGVSYYVIEKGSCGVMWSEYYHGEANTISKDSKKWLIATIDKPYLEYKEINI